MIDRLATESQARRAWDALAPELSRIPEIAVSRPHTDPRAAAVTAALVADVTHDDELAKMARLILSLLERLGGTYLPDGVRVSDEIVARGQAVRLSACNELARALAAAPDIDAWLDAVRRGEGATDLVYDLRTLAVLYETRAAGIPEPLAPLPGILHAAADAIEIALRADETREEEDARELLGRVWTLFVPAYEAARASASDRYPALALIAANQRARRRAAASTGRYEVVAHVEIERSEPPPPPPRSVIELEVSVTTESNFYVGFTENVSASGVFVATYAPHPVGAKVEIALAMPDGTTMRLPGVVRWVREATAEAWPGIGVELPRLSLEEEEQIRRFTALRAPLFFD